MKKKNGFTLIELLAIIVILAIIAVITVPIILNIIENSRKGAATDSAYGYKDAVNKYYVTELSKPENQNLILSGEYTVSTGGVLYGNGISNKEIPVSGDKPSAGELHYTNNTLQGGCLVIGDYQVIFDGGSVSSTTKGDCSDYDFSSSGSGEQGGSNVVVDPYSMAAMCPGCVFARNASEQSINQTLSVVTSNDYTDFSSSYVGYIVENNIVKRAFVCGMESNVHFCLEGYDSSKYSNNIDILNHFISGCNADSSNSPASCGGSYVYVEAKNDGYLHFETNCDDSYISDSGAAYCTGGTTTEDLSTD